MTGWAEPFYKQISLIGSSYKAVQVYYPVLLCKHLIFRYVLPEDIVYNLLKLPTYHWIFSKTTVTKMLTL